MEVVIVILGLTGYGGSGKDTFADILVENYGFTKIAFADPIREIMLAENPVVAVENGREVQLREVVDALGWTEAKQIYPRIREHMVALGSTAREVLGWRVWINRALTRAGNTERVVFSDVRLMDEGRILRDVCGAYLVRITRPGVGPAHAQESAGLPDTMIDYLVANDGELIDLKIKADLLMHRITVRSLAA